MLTVERGIFPSVKICNSIDLFTLFSIHIGDSHAVFTIVRYNVENIHNRLNLCVTSVSNKSQYKNITNNNQSTVTLKKYFDIKSEICPNSIGLMESCAI